MERAFIRALAGFALEIFQRTHNMAATLENRLRGQDAAHYQSEGVKAYAI